MFLRGHSFLKALSAIFLHDTRTLRISQDICYVRTTYIEFTMTIFGQCHNVLNNKYYYLFYNLLLIGSFTTGSGTFICRGGPCKHSVGISLVELVMWLVWENIWTGIGPEECWEENLRILFVNLIPASGRVTGVWDHTFYPIQSHPNHRAMSLIKKVAEFHSAKTPAPWE